MLYATVSHPWQRLPYACGQVQHYTICWQQGPCPQGSLVQGLLIKFLKKTALLNNTCRMVLKQWVITEFKDDSCVIVIVCRVQLGEYHLPSKTLSCSEMNKSNKVTFTSDFSDVGGVTGYNICLEWPYTEVKLFCLISSYISHCVLVFKKYCMSYLPRRKGCCSNRCLLLPCQLVLLQTLFHLLCQC